MPSITLATIIRLLMASLIVGFLLALFNITPNDVVAWVTGFFGGIWTNAEAFAGSIFSYILLGAVIVIPIWLISYAIKALNRK